MGITERRKLQRYDLHAPLRIESHDRNILIAAEILTKDISSKGAFIYTDRTNLQVGSKVHLEVILTINRLKELLGCSKKVALKVNGSVIRSMKEGVAVEFDTKYSITPEVFRTN